MVIVVGAGPAGAVAALTLARSGMAVTLLDRAVFPRNKPCGGGITMRALTRFPWLEPALDSIATHRISRLYLEGPDGHSVTIEADRPAVLMIRRVEFDAMLVQLAVAAGAILVSGVDIVRAQSERHLVSLESRDGRRFDAPVVIAADGVHSIVARRLGLNPGWPAGAVAVDMMEETPREALAADPATLWVAYGYAPPSLAQALTNGRASEGYAYIFPKRDHVNVGIGYVLDHFKSDVHGKPYDLQLEFVDHLRTRGLLSGDSVRRNFTPFIIPVGGPLKRPGRGRVIVAGDAGGFVNGFTAEGIYYAMATGEIAAQTVLRTRPHDVTARLASRYRRACAREFGGELRDAVLVQRHLFSDRRTIARAVTAAARDESVKQLIVDYATGRVSYKSLRRRVVARAPIAAVQLCLEHIRSSRAFRSWM